jgi:hypothetical protein
MPLDWIVTLLETQSLPLNRAIPAAAVSKCLLRRPVLLHFNALVAKVMYVDLLWIQGILHLFLVKLAAMHQVMKLNQLFAARLHFANLGIM